MPDQGTNGAGADRDLKKEMEAFDSLPEAVRLLYHGLPTPYDAIGLRMIARRDGLDDSELISWLENRIPGIINREIAKAWGSKHPQYGNDYKPIEKRSKRRLT